MSRRYVVFGAGAVGGAIGARLAQSGYEVALIARGAHLDAIRRDGLTLLTPAEEVTEPLPAAADPAELEVGRAGDVVLLAVKSQHTEGALEQLRAAGAGELPIVCLQNGVNNERSALRRSPAVYAAVVLSPASHIEPGVVEAPGAVLTGIIELGRYPSGEDALCHEIADALGRSRWAATVREPVMAAKYDKLVGNLANIVRALFAPGEDRDKLTTRVRDEGRAVLDGAGIAHEVPDRLDLATRWEQIGVAPIRGRSRGGSSTWQSLARGADSVETDYLNGEISLTARLHGLPSPLNDALCRLAADHVRAGAPLESLDAAPVLAAVPA